MEISRKLHGTAKIALPPIISIFEEAAVASAAKLIANGKIVALPTDTLYGIATTIESNSSIKKLYQIKKRDETKPIAICVSSVSKIHLWGETSHISNDLLESLLPGAVTIVLKRKSLLNPLLNPNSDRIGIRIPKFPFIQKLSNTCNFPFALTSANISSEKSPLRISEFQHLWVHLDGIFDGGVLGNTSVRRAGSTVIDLSEPGYYHIIRSGSALDSSLAILKNFCLRPKIKN